MGICDQVMCLRLIKVMVQLLEQLIDGAFVTTGPDGDVAVALGGNGANVFSASDIASVRCALIWDSESNMSLCSAANRLSSRMNKKSPIGIRLVRSCRAYVSGV